MQEKKIPTSSESTFVLRSPDDDSKAERRFYSLDELKRKKHLEHEEIQSEVVWAPPQRALPLPLRIAVRFCSALILLFIICLGGIVFLTSPWGESSMTSLLSSIVNYYGKPMDLRVHVASIRGFWDGKIEIVNLRIYDKYGPWIRVTQGTLHPDWESLGKSIVASWRVKHDREIPKNFYDTSGPIANIPRLTGDSYGVDLHATDKIATNDDKITSPKRAQSKARYRNSLGTAPRRSLNVVPQKSLIVNNLLNPEEILLGKVVLGLKSGTLVGTFMPRLPKYVIDESSDPINMHSLFDFLPDWLAIDVAKLEMVDFKLGPSVNSLNFSTNIHGQINSEKLLFRSTLLAAENISLHWVLPNMQNLPDDVSLSLRDFRERLNILTHDPKTSPQTLAKEKRILGYVSLDYDKGDMDIRWQIHDSLLSKTYAPGIHSSWSRIRILAHVPTWPPTVKQPTQARFVSRFGLTLTHEDKIIKPSLAVGQVFWDGDTFILRDFDVASPAEDPSLKILGSLGYSLCEGCGGYISAVVNELQTLANALGIDTKTVPIKGNVDANIYISHGGERLFWWTKPLPNILPNSPLPGFTASPYDRSIVAKSINRFTKNTLLSISEINYKSLAGYSIIKSALDETKKPTTNPFPKAEKIPLPIASLGEESFHFRVKVASKELTLPDGEIKDLFFSINGNSVYSASVPKIFMGIFPPKKLKSEQEELKAEQEKRAQEKLLGLDDEHADEPKDPEPIDTFTSDFNEAGLPYGLVGKVMLRFGDLYGKGVGKMTSNWFLGGYHEESKRFQLNIDDFSLALPGISSDANLSFAYALPIVKRRWPWVDGEFNLHIHDWELLEHIFHPPLQAENLNFHAIFRSFVDEKGTPLQHFNSKFLSDRVESPEFMVRKTTGTAQSDHFHAVADTVVLSLARYEEALQKQMYYTPADNIPTFMAELELDSGRGGPVRWSRGNTSMTIYGEQANFSVSMLGEITALLEGLYNFRTRTLSLKDMNVRTPISNTKK